MSIILQYHANARTNELVLLVLTRELIMLLIASYEQELMNTLKEQTKLFVHYHASINYQILNVTPKGYGYFIQIVYAQYRLRNVYITEHP